MADRLWEYPYVLVRLGCSVCSRSGQYRLARLAAKYGAEIELDDLLERLAFDCPWRTPPGARPPGKYDPKCKAHFVDLSGPPTGPDMPPVSPKLRLVRGGRG